MRKLAVLCCLLVVLAGCPAQTPRPVDVDVWIKDPTVRTHNQGVAFRGVLVVENKPWVEEFELEGVRVVFENDTEVVQTIQLGTVSELGIRRNISASLPEPPDRVRIEVGEVRIDREDSVKLVGLQRNGTGGYEYVQQSS